MYEYIGLNKCCGCICMRENIFDFPTQNASAIAAGHILLRMPATIKAATITTIYAHSKTFLYVAILFCFCICFTYVRVYACVCVFVSIFTFLGSCLSFNKSNDNYHHIYKHLSSFPSLCLSLSLSECVCISLCV